MGTKRGSNNPILSEGGWLYIPRSNKYTKTFGKNKIVIRNKVDHKSGYNRHWLVYVNDETFRGKPLCAFCRIKSAKLFIEAVGYRDEKLCHKNLQEEIDAYQEFDAESMRRCVTKYFARKLPEEKYPKTDLDWEMLDEAITIKALIAKAADEVGGANNPIKKMAAVMAIKPAIEQLQQDNRERWKEKYGYESTED